VITVDCNLNVNYILIINSQIWGVVFAVNRLSMSILSSSTIKHMLLQSIRNGYKTYLLQQKYTLKAIGDSLALKLARASFSHLSDSTIRAKL